MVNLPKTPVLYPWWYSWLNMVVLLNTLLVAEMWKQSPFGAPIYREHGVPDHEDSIRTYIVEVSPGHGLGPCASMEHHAEREGVNAYLDGQQTGVATKALEKVTPCSTINDCRWGMKEGESNRMS